MDRRNEQVLPVSSPILKSCIHTKNIFSLIDLSPEEELHKKMNKHVQGCSVCTKELQNFQLKNFEAKITPKGKSGFTIGVQAKNSIDAKKMMEAQYPGATIHFFKELK